MLNKFFNNPFVIAAKRTMLAYAISHLFVLISAVIITKNWELLNLFRILQLDMVLPGLGKGFDSFFASFIFTAIIFMIFLVTERKS